MRTWPVVVRRIVWALIAAGGVCWARPAAAQHLDDWPEEVPRFHPAEYAGTAALLGGALALRFGPAWTSEPNIEGGLPGEEGVFEALYPDSADSRKAWEIAADIPFFSSFLWSATEPLTASLAGSWDLGTQILLMNLEGYAVTASVLWTTQLVLRRRRPTDRPCDDPSITVGRNDRCDEPGTVRAFIGGHTATVATATALTCIHHIELGLYGSAFRDAVPCAVWIAGTAITFSGRSVTGSHYLSDNLLGLGLGTLAGLVPWSLHYARRAPVAAPSADLPAIRGIAVAPLGGDGSALMLSGTLP